MKWFFRKVGPTIEFTARAEGPGGAVGDARSVWQRGEKRFGMSYDDFAKMRSGVVEFDGEKFSVISSEKPL